MIKAILYIRLMQFTRFIKQVGILRGIFLLGILAVVLFMFYTYSLNPGSENSSSIVFFLLLVTLNVTRKDKHFLRVNFHSFKRIMLVEYLLLSLPAIIFYLFLQNWKASFYMVSAAFAAAILPVVSPKNMNMGMLRFILFPNTPTNSRLNIPVPINNPLAFEWISGLRRFFPVLFPLYLLALGFSYKPYVGPVGIILISGLISSFFQYGEPREFIEVFAGSWRSFLFKKVLLNVRLTLIVLSPIFFSSLLFQQEIYYWSIGAIVISLFIQILAIIFKYGLFAENRDLSANSMVLMINIMCLVVPLFWPVPLIMGIKYFNKAKINLKSYFDD